MTERITSRRNPLLEQVRRLDTAALRRKAGVFLCDSPKLVGEAVQHGVSVPYKAIVTEHNLPWTLRALYDELVREHEAMHG